MQFDELTPAVIIWQQPELNSVPYPTVWHKFIGSTWRQCFIAAILYPKAQLRDCQSVVTVAHNYQRKINETLPEGSIGIVMPGDYVVL